MPRKLRHDLHGFDIRTVQQEGWAGLENGNLLRRASESFDVLLTADQRLRFQQNVSHLDIAVVIVETFDTTLPNLRRFLAEITRAIEDSTTGRITIVRAE